MTKSKNYKEWQANYKKEKERKEKFRNISFANQPNLVTKEDLPENHSEEIGFPGQFPYTRGIHTTGYRGKLWTFRQFSGFGTAKDTNNRFKYLLNHGQTGLSTAFDMPTLMGYDPDSDFSIGEVGREGVSIATIDDMEELFAGIPLDEVSVSMTINCTAPIIMACYFAIAKRRNIDLNFLQGTIQNDILKEFIAQKEWISPPKPSIKLACDIIEYCSINAKKFNPISISGYHIREGGSTAVQELAFTIADGITYIEHCLGRGMKIDNFAPRLSFFFDIHNDFFEEIAKLRAARRIWAKLMRDRFGAKDERSLKLRTHAQTAGVSLTAQQPMNNVARVAIQALAGVLGGVQSLHTNSMDETLSLPTEQAALVALRTQQILSEETGVANTIDPLGGSYYVEDLTNKIEAETYEYINKIDKLGGMLGAIEVGFPQKEISEASYKFQLMQEKKEYLTVGVNSYTEGNDQKINILKIDHSIEADRIEQIKTFKNKRDQKKVLKHLDNLEKYLREDKNIMPALIEAVEDGATLGEVSNLFRKVLGVYRDPGMV